MKKIGITTFHRATNYGAVLQAYALQKYVSDLGYDVRLIDYTCDINDHSDLMNIRRYISNPQKAIGSIYLRKRCKKFYGFVDKFINTTERSYTKQNIDSFDESEFDLLITGSDQVWNPDIIQDENAFLLDFVNDDRKKCSYAASIGLENIDDTTKERFKKYLSNYKGISVREKRAVDILKECGIDHVKLVCDPTLLIDAKEWEILEADIKIPEKYILLFSFGKDDLLWNCAKYLQKQTGYKICKIDNNIRPASDYIKLSGIGPGEWVYLIHHAEYVLTNSFHGMMFSLIFKKKFGIFIPKDGTCSRIREMLGNVDCMDRLIEDDNFQKIMLDYDDFDEKINDYVNNSKCYLNTILSDI